MKLALAAATACAALALPAALRAEGGETIASAPDIPLAIGQFSSRLGPDYWRIFLGLGDLLVVDYGSTDGEAVGLCILPPAIASEAALSDESCIGGRDSTIARHRISLEVVRAAGRWTLAFADGLCVPSTYTSGTCKAQRVSYYAVVTVQRYTEVSLTMPTAGVRGSVVVLSGRVRGTSSGVVEIETRRGSRWVSLGLRPIDAHGVFSRKVRLPGQRGVVNYRATYYGDDQHRPSGRAVAIRSV